MHTPITPGSGQETQPVPSGLRKKIIRAALPAIACAVVFSLPNLGTLAGLLLLVWLFWLPFGLYVIIARGEQRYAQAAMLAIWLGAAIASNGAQLIRARAAENSAEMVLAKTEDYFARTGRYPENPAALGLDETALRAMPGRPLYRYSAGKPHLYYTPGTIVLLEYWYDFEQKRWRLALD